ncbi:MAG: NADH-quinone oxidoreductase subunit N [Planctomycetaceae bacterium]
MTILAAVTTLPTSLESFSLVAPEIALVVAALAAFLGGAFLGLRSGWVVAILGIAAAWALAGGQPADAATITSGGVRVDGFSTFIRWLVLGLGALLALVQSGDLFATAMSRGPGIRRGGTCEEAGTFLLLLAGLSLVGVAGDLVLLFVGLELVSIPTYILLALKRIDAHGQEASLKYFFLSLVSSSLLLYAAVCLYGIGGSTDLQSIAARLQSTDAKISGMATILLPAALGMAMVGAAFRLAAVPMHFYAPDVYEGTSPGNAALLSTLPKVAGLVVLARLLGLAIAPDATAAAQVGPAAQASLDLLWKLAVVLAAVTMTVGNVMALWQRNLRRLLGCSSIAHAGYLLVGVAVAAAAGATQAGQPLGDTTALDTGWTMVLGGMTSSLFYLATYALATIGIFGAVAYLGHRWPEWTAGSGPRPPREEIATVDDLDGLASTNPVAAFAIAAFLLSLAGIPPLPGFWGKLSLAASALQVDWNAAISLDSRRGWFVGLAVVLVLNAAIAAAYYLRIISAMYFKTTKRGVQADGGIAAGLAMLACLVLVAAVTVQPRRLFMAASRAGDAVSGTLPVAVADARPTIPGR